MRRFTVSDLCDALESDFKNTRKMERAEPLPPKSASAMISATRSPSQSVRSKSINTFENRLSKRGRDRERIPWR